MSAEFPRLELTCVMARHGRLLTEVQANDDRAVIVRAVEVYDQLAERLTRERCEFSLHIANLRARLREVDPEFTS